MYMMKPVRCDNCKYWERNSVYKTEGKCKKSGTQITREHWACNLLPENKDKREAKINLYK